MPLPRQAAAKGLLRALFVLWAVVATLAVTGLGTAHWYAFPAPSASDRALASAIHEARTHAEARVLLHVLYAKCACSRRIFSHLLTRGAQPGSAETIVLVDGDAALQRDLSARGYRVLPTAPDELEKRYGVSAAPLLVVALADDAPLYVGGYTARKQSLEIEDTRIVSALERGAHPAFLPLFGCAVSEDLQRMLDPLGLKVSAMGARLSR